MACIDQVGEKRFDFSFDRGEGDFWRRVGSILDFPEVELIQPIRELLGGERLMFAFIESDDDVGHLEVFGGEGGGGIGGVDEVDVPFLQCLLCVWRELVGAIQLESAREGAPAEAFGLSVVVEEGLCKSAPIRICGGDEQDGGDFEHGG